MTKNIRRTVSITILMVFISSSVNITAFAQADPIPFMPVPGAMVHLSPEFTPACLKGIVIHPQDPLKFDFIIDKGDQFTRQSTRHPDADLRSAQGSLLEQQLKRQEYKKLIKYFLASLAIPDDDQWVNLSPYEKGRIIKDDFGKTEMGRDLLAQDYLLKQITASLIYPENDLGKEFWSKVYAQAQKQYGTTNIPVNTFNKVWILPDDALIYENGNMAYILKNHLRVMLEEDYLSLQKHSGISTDVITAQAGLHTGHSQDLGIHNKNNAHSIASNIIRQIVLPELQREVNEDKNFAPLRQVYSGMLLATWFKRTLKKSLLGQIYVNKAKVRGVDQDPRTNEEIYQRYVQAYKKGVFNFVKEDRDKYTDEAIPRKYFSGGVESEGMAFQKGIPTSNNRVLGDGAMLNDEAKEDMATVALKKDAAMKVGGGKESTKDVGMSGQEDFEVDWDKVYTQIQHFSMIQQERANGAVIDPPILQQINIVAKLGRIGTFGHGLNMLTGPELRMLEHMGLVAKKSDRMAQEAKGDFGRIIKEAREGKHWTQDQLAQELGVSRSSISRYENGTMLPRDSKLNNVARVLSLDVGDLLMAFLKAKGITIQRNSRAFTLKLGRVTKGLSQKNLATQMGVAPGTVSRSEQGLVLRESTLSKFAQTHNLDMDHLKQLPDRASVAQPHLDRKGGIDMNSANLNLRIKRDGKGMSMISQQDLAQLTNMEGLDPVILSIKPASQTALFAELVAHP